MNDVSKGEARQVLGALPRGRRRGDRLMHLAAALAAVITTGGFGWMMAELVAQGTRGWSWEYLTAAPGQSGRAGGIGPVLAATILIVAVCLAAAGPIGLGASLLLSEFTNREGLFGRLLRRSLDALAGAPSIVFGLFGNAFFCVYLGMGFSVLAGGLTLACMILPIVIRSGEASLRSTSPEQRLAAAALGLSKSTMIWRLLLPAAAPGLAAGMALGIGRALAETAALIYTSGFVDRMPRSLSDSGRALSVHVYELAANTAGGAPSAYRAALVLMILVGVSQWITRWLFDRLLGRRIATC